MTLVRIPAPVGVGPARLSVRLMAAGKPVLGFQGYRLRGEYADLPLDEDQILDLPATSSIALPGRAATYYEVIIRSTIGAQRFSPIAVPERDTEVQLRDLAAAADPDVLLVQGPPGAPGPNAVTSATKTIFSGLLCGDGSRVGAIAIGDIALGDLSDDSTHRLITDEERTEWTAKQGALGYIPQDVAAKGGHGGYCGLDAGGKVPLANLPATLLQYIGVWDAESNSPELTAHDASKVGLVYVVGVAGACFGFSWAVGDWAIYNADGDIELSLNSDAVVSVCGQTGVVSLGPTDVGAAPAYHTHPGAVAFGHDNVSVTAIAFVPSLPESPDAHTAYFICPGLT